MLRLAARAQMRDPGLAHKISGASLLISSAYSVVAMASTAAASSTPEHYALDELPNAPDDTRLCGSKTLGDWRLTDPRFRFVGRTEFQQSKHATVESLVGIGLAEYQQKVQAYCKAVARLPRCTESATQAIAEPHSAQATRSVSSDLDGLIHEIFRAAESDIAIDALTELLRASDTIPTVHTFATLIMGLSKLRHEAAAWASFLAMIRLGYRPDECTIIAVLKLCVQASAKREFCQVMRIARKAKSMSSRRTPSGSRESSSTGRANAVRRSKEAFEAIIQGCLHFGELKRAETYLKLMRGEGNRPDVHLHMSMLDGYLRHLDKDPRHRAHGLRHAIILLTMGADELKTLSFSTSRPSRKDCRWNEKTAMRLLQWANKTDDQKLALQVYVLAEEMGLSTQTIRSWADRRFTRPNRLKAHSQQHRQRDMRFHADCLEDRGRSVAGGTAPLSRSAHTESHTLRTMEERVSSVSLDQDQHECLTHDRHYQLQHPHQHDQQFHWYGKCLQAVA
ncbi:hypothetical protein PYCC9005_006027 [Savitreella phatthalungensis]